MTKTIGIKLLFTIFITSLACSNISLASSANLQISTANTHSCSITADRAVACWGNLADAKLGFTNEDGFIRRVPMVPPMSTPPNISAITRGVATGNRHTCAIVDESPATFGSGLVKCWGNNSEGQLGNGSLAAQTNPYPVKFDILNTGDYVPITNVNRIVAGEAHTCAYRSYGDVWCWGRNTQGQLGINKTSPHETYAVRVLTDSGEPFYSTGQLAAGNNHTCTVGYENPANKGIYCWGAGLSGQLGTGAIDNKLTAFRLTPLPTAYSAMKLSAGNTHTCALENNSLWCWGNWGLNSFSTPQQLAHGNSSLIDIASGNNHICLVVSDTSQNIDREVRCFGINSDGQLGNGSTSAYLDIANWTRVKGLNSPALRIDGGGSQTCTILENGSIACWGLNGAGQLGDGLRNNAVSAVTPGWSVALPTQPTSAIKSFSLGWAHTCALKNDQVKCWGHNQNGQLGSGSPIGVPQKLPIPVTGFGPGKVTALASGNLHTCALLDTGNIQCWGSNQAGQLGNGTLVQSQAPVTVQLSSTDVAKSVIAAGDYSCAILKDETAKCWGSNSHGQLGAGLPMSTHSTVPVSVSGLVGVKQLSAKMVHTCALMNTGTTKCWGANYAGQLGNNNYTNTNIPVDNALWINDVTKVSAGSEQTCVLRINGTVWCWGRTVANGNAVTTNYPLNIAFLNKISDISAGNFVTCARMQNGTFKCFGNNLITLGDGDDLPSTGNSFLPNSIRYLSSPALTIEQSRYMHACANLTTGELSCWGSNYSGQLGNNTTTDSSKPVIVQNL